MSKPRVAGWASENSEREYFRLYDQFEAEYFHALQKHDVKTGLGPTRVYEQPGTGEPLVLLPGSGVPALMWAPLLEHLPEAHVFAFDTIGDVGRSVQQAPIPSRAAYMGWLDDALDGLECSRAHFAGASYGGWVALGYAQHAPDRVASLTLAEPVLDPIRKLFWLHGMATGLALLLPMSLRAAAARKLHMNAIATDDKRIRRFGFLGQARYRRGIPRFVPVDDAELAALTTPTLVLLGENSAIHHSGTLADRLRKIGAPIRVEVVPDAGHSLPVDHADLLAERLRAE